MIKQTKKKKKKKVNLTYNVSVNKFYIDIKLKPLFYAISYFKIQL